MRSLNGKLKQGAINNCRISVSALLLYKIACIYVKTVVLRLFATFCVHFFIKKYENKISRDLFI